MKQAISKQGRALEIYFHARATIPHGNLLERTFEEFVADHVGTIARICETFSLKPPANFKALTAKARQARPLGFPPGSWLPLVLEHYKLFLVGALILAHDRRNWATGGTSKIPNT